VLVVGAGGESETEGAEENGEDGPSEKSPGEASFGIAVSE